MVQKLKQRKQGFTIIEVLIVLAIAGLIMLIVFLAVPALQRTSRNTQRKNDASAVASAVANFISNNGGSLPVAGGVAADTDPNSVDICSTAGCAGTHTFEAAKLGFYTPGNVSIKTPTAGGLQDTSTTTIVVALQYGCNATNTGAGSTKDPRTAAILYAVENTGGATGSPQCVEQ